MILLILQALWKPKGAAQNLIGVQMCPVHTTNDPEIIGLGRLGPGWKLILKGVRQAVRICEKSSQEIARDTTSREMEGISWSAWLHLF